MKNKIVFENGYAKGYEFALPKFFESSLTNKKFEVGEVFYNNPAAYELNWKSAMELNITCLQVKSVISENIEFDIMKPNKSKNKLEIIESKTAMVEDFIEILKFGIK